MADGQGTPRTVVRRRKAPELAVKSASHLDACIAESDLFAKEIAAVAEVHESFISALRTGRKKGCKAATAQAIARALGRPTADLFTAGVAPRQRPRRTPTTALEG